MPLPIDERDQADARRWRALVEFWKTSDNPTDLANYVADLLQATVEELAEA